MTHQRQVILEAVKNTKGHPTADAIYEKVRKILPRVSMGTVYRNLNSLAKSGDIRQLDIADGTSRFDGNTDNHYHFRCEECGHIFDLDEPVDQTFFLLNSVKLNSI